MNEKNYNQVGGALELKPVRRRFLFTLRLIPWQHPDYKYNGWEWQTPCFFFHILPTTSTNSGSCPLCLSSLLPLSFLPPNHSALVLSMTIVLLSLLSSVFSCLFLTCPFFLLHPCPCMVSTVPIGGDLAPSLGGIRKKCSMTFLGKNFHFNRDNFWLPYFSHRLCFLPLFTVWHLIYNIMALFFTKNLYFRKHSFMTPFLLSSYFHTHPILLEILGDGCMGGPSHQSSLGLRPRLFLVFPILCVFYPSCFLSLVCCIPSCVLSLVCSIPSVSYPLCVPIFCVSYPSCAYPLCVRSLVCPIPCASYPLCILSFTSSNPRVSYLYLGCSIPCVFYPSCVLFLVCPILNVPCSYWPVESFPVGFCSSSSTGSSESPAGFESCCGPFARSQSPPCSFESAPRILAPSPEVPLPPTMQLHHTMWAKLAMWF